MESSLKTKVQNKDRTTYVHSQCIKHTYVYNLFLSLKEQWNVVCLCVLLCAAREAARVYRHE